jgi:hypothetical protein
LYYLFSKVLTTGMSVLWDFFLYKYLIYKWIFKFSLTDKQILLSKLITDSNVLYNCFFYLSKLYNIKLLQDIWR